MKKIIALLAFVVAFSMVNGQVVTINGLNKSKDKVNRIISLQALVDGSLKVIATTQCGEKGKFGFIVEIPYEGFYAIGAEELMDGYNPIYLKANDVVNIEIDSKQLSFVGKNSPENNTLGKWLELSENVKNKSLYFMNVQSTYVDFFPDLDKLIKDASIFENQISTPNSKFNKRMIDLIGFDLDLYAINFLYAPRSMHPSKDSLPSFYSNIVRKDKYNNDDIFETIYGQRTIRLYAEFAGRSSNTFDLESRISVLNTNRQKADYLTVMMLNRLKDYEGFLKFVGKYGKYYVGQSQKMILENKGSELFSSKSGAFAADFTYPDINGKMVSLSDFKGKVVLVDVWATWCGPCQQEIPFMKELEKEFHGKDVVFLSVSVDEERNKQAWLNMIKEKGMGGVQLFASGWSKITKDYRITGIPRFMVFDKKGNVVSVDSPRPSSPKLKEMLNSELIK